MNDRLRAVAIVAAGVAGVVGLAASGSSAKSSSSSSSNPTGVSTQSNNSQYPPQADVTVDTCTGPDEAGFVKIAGTIVNHSPKASNYIIEGNLVAGSTKVGEFSDIESNVAAGQTAKWTSEGDDNSPSSGSINCKLVSVDRTAASG